MKITDLPKTGAVRIGMWDSFEWEYDPRYPNTIRLQREAESDNAHLDAEVTFPNGEMDLTDTSNWNISIGKIDQNGGHREVDDDYISYFDSLFTYWEKNYGKMQEADK